MKTVGHNKKTALPQKLREPIYASILLALFADLRREFALARSAD